MRPFFSFLTLVCLYAVHLSYEFGGYMPMPVALLGFLTLCGCVALCGYNAIRGEA
jgi:hypothetical protein